MEMPRTPTESSNSIRYYPILVLMLFFLCQLYILHHYHHHCSILRLGKSKDRRVGKKDSYNNNNNDSYYWNSANGHWGGRGKVVAYAVSLKEDPEGHDWNPRRRDCSAWVQLQLWQFSAMWPWATCLMILLSFLFYEKGLIITLTSQNHKG